MQKTVDMSAGQFCRFFMPPANSLLLAIYLILNSMAVQAVTVQVVDVPHDGYCLFHAISHCLANSELTPPDALELYGQMQQFLLENQHNHMLDAALHTYPVAGSLQELAAQFNTFPSINNPESWAGLPEVVVMSVMLGQPILMLHLDQNQVISNNSFLVDQYNIFPLETLEGGSHDVPGIQLILSGREWSAIELDGLLGQWQGQLHNYIQQLGMLFSGHPSGIAQSVTDDRTESIHDLLLTHARPVILESNNVSPQGLNRLEFSGQWEEWMLKYANAKMLVMQACWNMEQETDWSDEEVRSFGATIDSYCHILKSRFARWYLQYSLLPYLQAVGLSVDGLVSYLIPGVQNLWTILISLKPTINNNSHAAGGQNLAQIINSIFDTTQSETPTKGPGWKTAPSTIPGVNQPSFIENRSGLRLVAFNRLDPIHHLLFALNLSARCYKIACLCLALSRIGGERGLASDVKSIGAKTFWQWIVDTEARCQKHLKHCQAAIHAFGRAYFAEVWQMGSYQVLKLQDGDCVLFFSDDFQPRGGWIDLMPEKK